MNKLPLILILALSSTILTLKAQQNNPAIASGQLLHQADNLFDSGQYKKAIAVYRQIDRNDTNYVKAIYGASVAYYEDSQFDASLEYAKKGLSLTSDPEKLPDLYNQYGNTLSAMGRTTEALGVFDSAIQKYPAYGLLYLNKGNVLITLEQYAKAEAIFKQALVIDPYTYSCHFKLGHCALQQGKLVPAFLSFLGYLLMSPEGRYNNLCIRALRMISNNLDTIQTLISRRKEDSDENYALVEQILQSKIALDKSYKPLIQLDDPISRQIQVVFEKMEYKESDDDFWMQYYIPLFKQVYSDNQFEYFINRIFSSVNLPIIQDFNKKYKKELSGLVNSTADYFNVIRKTRMLAYTKRGTDSILWSFSNDQLRACGKYDAGKDLALGPWDQYFWAGNRRGTGAYNGAGRKEGPFVYYRFDGSLEGKELYTDGKQEGEETYYFSNGVVSTHSWYKNNLLDGEYTAYFWVGTPNTITRYRAGKADGVKIGFYNNGDTSYLETWSAGALNGPAKSWSNYRTIETITAYKDGNLDGPCQKFHPNGKLSAEGAYKDGKMEGEWKWYHPNGHLKTTQGYVKDNAQGECHEYFDNDTLSSIYTMKNGTLEGDMRYFDRDGKLYGLLHHSNGVLQKAQFFDKSGKMVSESVPTGHSINRIDCRPDGTRRAMTPYNEKGEVNGTQTFYYSSGKILETDEYAAGLEQGPMIAYFANGNKKVETMYANGKMDGYHKSYYYGGQIQEEGWYKEGEAEGYWLSYNELGVLTDSSFFSHGNLDGYKVSLDPNGKRSAQWKYYGGWLVEWTQYDTTGKLLEVLKFPAGSGQLRLVYPDGKPNISGTYVRSKLTGPYNSWYIDGAKMVEAHYTAGMLDSVYRSYDRPGSLDTEGWYSLDRKTGKWKYYYPDGKLRVTEEYVEGMLNGNQVFYYRNGQIQTQTMYKGDQKEGVSERYDQDGTLLYRINFSDNDPISYTYLDKKGSILPERPIPAGTGKIKTWFPNGQVAAEFEYKDGFLAGEQRFYHPNGRPASFAQWSDNNREGNDTTWYPNGQIWLACTYLHDDLNGVYREYTEKGVLKEESNFYIGTQQGPSKLYDDTGRLIETDLYHYGTIFEIKK